MAFITGTFLIDAPASALNNSGDAIEGARTENTSSTKFIKTRQGNYPYVSAQALRFWLRNTLLRYPEFGWQSSPIGREQKIAYTDANPLDWWDDDLFGYMRAPSKKKKEKNISVEALTPIESDKEGDAAALTRVSPFRASTLVAIEPVYLTNDFGVMARHEGDPVPFEHQFYRATLKGLFSIDMRSAGTFTFRERTGFRNLDKVRRQMAEEQGLEQIGSDAYRLPFEQRVKRVQALLYAFGRLEGGAKQALHYTDVSPAFTMAAVTRGGNHPFGRVIAADRGEPVLRRDALEQVLDVLQEDLLSGIYVGRTVGFMDTSAASLAELSLGDAHPREALDALAAEIGQHPEWWE
ncbi:MAG: type I-B CRISPR-associated protein Cas7/Cst2/DevR [Anaerolineae bacterium]|nr:type I-B CRISPR-associated protein Cas7/Cst2/DevR [Anaerolineae bacterium]